MKLVKSTLIAALLASSALVAGCATETVDAPVATGQEVVLPNTRVLQLNSAAGGAYRIFIAAPSEPAPEGGYPVIYITDGNSIFGAMRDELIRQLDTTYRTPTLLVAIGYPEDSPWNPRREQDLTPVIPGIENITGPWGEHVPNVGGADDFLDFIETVVKPSVEAQYPVDRTRQTLTGHSFGGLFTLYTFFTRPTAFQSYVAMSPSIWLGDRHILTEEAAYRATYPGTPDTSRLLIMVGECEQIVGECDAAVPSTPRRDAWLVPEGRMVDNAKEMQARLAELKGEDVQVHIIPHEHHISVIGASLSRVTRFALAEPIIAAKEAAAEE